MMTDPDRSLLAYLAPPPELPLWKWAEANIVLTDRQSRQIKRPAARRKGTTCGGREVGQTSGIA
jgi:hypothetical protein